jgi:hypothetical protein
MLSPFSQVMCDYRTFILLYGGITLREYYSSSANSSDSSKSPSSGST